MNPTAAVLLRRELDGLRHMLAATETELTNARLRIGQLERGLTLAIKDMTEERRAFDLVRAVVMGRDGK